MPNFSDEPGEEQIRALRRMTPVQRLMTGISLCRFARQLKLAELRQQHPDWSESQLNRRLKELFLYASD